MKYWEILSESAVGKAAMDYKRSNRYPDGTDIPESLPPRYQPASFPGVPKGQRCDNCGYYDTKTKKCDKFKGDPVVKPAYWCLKWEPMEEEVTEGWSKNYKNSINCSNPKGFSQKAHCAGKKKAESIEEGYGRYYCSTDKKWKTRKGPKQTRRTSSSN